MIKKVIALTFFVFDQIADIPDSYILADMMEYPVGKKLPLWIVGLTY
ncbi:MAG: hypothetical protein K6A94_02265 [Bacteroidales bacterium]|nr:hypothetical protein [Bacteroidales bacterium]